MKVVCTDVHSWAVSRRVACCCPVSLRARCAAPRRGAVPCDLPTFQTCLFFCLHLHCASGLSFSSNQISLRSASWAPSPCRAMPSPAIEWRHVAPTAFSSPQHPSYRLQQPFLQPPGGSCNYTNRLEQSLPTAPFQHPAASRSLWQTSVQTLASSSILFRGALQQPLLRINQPLIETLQPPPAASRRLLQPSSTTRSLSSSLSSLFHHSVCSLQQTPADSSSLQQPPAASRSARQPLQQPPGGGDRLALFLVARGPWHATRHLLAACHDTLRGGYDWSGLARMRMPAVRALVVKYRRGPDKKGTKDYRCCCPLQYRVPLAS